MLNQYREIPDTCEYTMKLGYSYRGFIHKCNKGISYDVKRVKNILESLIDFARSHNCT